MEENKIKLDKKLDLAKLYEVPKEPLCKPESRFELHQFSEIYDFEIKKQTVFYENRTGKEFDILKFLEWLYGFLENNLTESGAEIYPVDLRKAGFIESRDIPILKLARLGETISSIGFEIETSWRTIRTNLCDEMSYQKTRYFYDDDLGPVPYIEFSFRKQAIWIIDRLLKSPDKDQIKIVERWRNMEGKKCQ